MASLKNRKINYLFNMDGITLRNPNRKEREGLKQIIIDNCSVTNEEFLTNIGMGSIRYILKTLTNIDNEEIDDMTDEELDGKLDEDRVMSELGKSIIELIEWMSDEVVYDSEKKFKSVNSLIKAIEENKKVDDIKKRWDKVAKANKLPSFDEIVNSENKKEELKKKIEGIN